MKVTIVPAQVTTVEDRIIGNLVFSQMMLLIVPVFIGAGLFAALPPVMGSSPYKFTIMGVLAFVCCVLAIRVRGKILALWAIQILHYNLRPKFYLFDKNTAAHREQYKIHVTDRTENAESTGTTERATIPWLQPKDAVPVYEAINNPASRIRYEVTKKGGLNVRLAENEK